MPLLLLHVNYVEQGQTIEEMFARAADWGYDGIELRRKRAGIDEPPEAYLDACARAAARSGLREVVFGGGPNLILPDETARREEIAGFIRFYELALERFPLRFGNLLCGALLNPDKNVPYWDYAKQGSGIAEKTHWEQSVAGLREIGAFAQSRRLRFALETHMSFLHDLPAVTLDLLARTDSPAIGLNLDCGNLLYLPGVPPLPELLDLCLPRLFYIHLKNALEVPGGVLRCGLAEGQINHREYLRLLQHRRYDGPLCLEAPRAGDREWFARQDLAYLRGLLRDLNWK